MGNDKRGEDLVISKSGVTIPVGSLLDRFVPERMARAEAIRTLVQSATAKIREGVELQPEERNAYNRCMPRDVQYAENRARVFDRAAQLEAAGADRSIALCQLTPPAL